MNYLYEFNISNTKATINDIVAKSKKNNSKIYNITRFFNKCIKSIPTQKELENMRNKNVNYFYDDMTNSYYINI